MKYESLPYFEKLESLYVLLETKQMLQDKLTKIDVTDPGYKVIEEDLKKIEHEMLEYTNGQYMDSQKVNPTLFNPAVFQQMEGD
ncbi:MULTISPECIES: hypothetical protein [Bacillaceae]|uniref:Uncharacterized protein n=1 Tax=Evansella alkalicola TaxID=745819 RepID=A0ABS6JRC9_9BACI|nr:MULTISPECIES: hypothetical protein [Bacillaceae]MBU9720646.1 hypothetical protein [Bacillus alkalicola]